MIQKKLLFVCLGNICRSPAAEAVMIGKLKKAGKDQHVICDSAGTIGFHNTDRVNEKTEIGYWLIRNMVGNGIITRACKTLVEIAFEKMGMNRITIKCAVSNAASARVPIRLGFTFEGIERNGERYNELFLDLKVFSLLKIEYDHLFTGQTWNTI